MALTGTHVGFPGQSFCGVEYLYEFHYMRCPLVIIAQSFIEVAAGLCPARKAGDAFFGCQVGVQVGNRLSGTAPGGSPKPLAWLLKAAFGAGLNSTNIAFAGIDCLRL